MSSCPEAHAKWFCLNGSTCFTVKIRESILYNCWCSTGFHGLRCEYKYTRSRQNQVIEESKSDASGVQNESIEIGNNLISEPLNDLEEFLTVNSTDLHTFSSLNSHKDVKQQATLIVYNLALLIILVSIMSLIVYRFFKSRNNDQSYDQPTNFNLQTMVSCQVSNNFDQARRSEAEQRSDRISRSFHTIESARLNAGLNQSKRYNQDLNCVSASNESFEYNANIDYLHYQQPCIGIGGSDSTRDSSSSSSSSRWLRHHPINHDSRG